MNKSSDISELMRFQGIRKDKPRSLAPSRGLYPSKQFLNIGGKGFGNCPRETYYSSKFPEKAEENYRLKCLAEMGILIEEMLINFTKEIGAYVTSQLQLVDNEAFWSGKVDIIVNDFEFTAFNSKQDVKIDYSTHIPIEVKSVYGYYGKKGVIVSNTKTKASPKPNAVMQLALYVDFLQRHGYNTPYGIIWYIGRDEGDSKSYKLTIEKREVATGTKRFIKIDDELYENFTIEALVEQNLTTKSYIDNEIVPPRAYTLQYNSDRLNMMLQNNELSKEDAALVSKGRFTPKGDFGCEYCNFNKFCYKSIGRSEEIIREKLWQDVDNILWLGE